MKKWSQNILLTRGENGLSLIGKNNTYHIKSKAEEVLMLQELVIQ